MFSAFSEVFSQIPTWVKVCWGVCLVIGAGFAGTLVYVLVHFAMKFW